jgi:hypothetical protein
MELAYIYKLVIYKHKLQPSSQVFNSSTLQVPRLFGVNTPD